MLILVLSFIFMHICTIHDNPSYTAYRNNNMLILMHHLSIPSVSIPLFISQHWINKTFVHWTLFSCAFEPKKKPKEKHKMRFIIFFSTNEKKIKSNLPSTFDSITSITFLVRDESKWRQSSTTSLDVEWQIKKHSIQSKRKQ